MSAEEQQLIEADPLGALIAEVRPIVLGPFVVARLRVARWTPRPCPPDWRPR